MFASRFGGTKKPGILPLIFLVLVFVLQGCAGPRISLFPDETEPLKEFTLRGSGEGKVVVVSVNGIISDSRKSGFFRHGPSMVQEVVSQLKMAEKDKEVKAVLLKVNSPGGTTTASDILYHELMDFKNKTGAKIIVCMMGVAASGGYYISLPADYIVAHPTTITGSVGVIFLRPEAYSLMDKIGLDVKVSKSGRNKDMGSPFRQPTEEEDKLFNDLITGMSKRFIGLVARHRKISPDAMDKIRTARVFSAEDALKLGLVDKIGYIDDSIAMAKKLAGMPGNAKVVAYRRTRFPNDNIYNTTSNKYPVGHLSLVEFPMANAFRTTGPGFYYLWSAGAGGGQE